MALLNILGPVTQSVQSLGLVSAVTTALDVGLTTGAASVTVGDAAALVTLPTSGTLIPGVSIMTANPPSPNPLNKEETYQGNSGDDYILADGRHDWAMGGSGADTIHGGDGHDHLYGFGTTPGPDGGDLIFGGNGHDYIQGNAGSDTLDGGAGNDRMLGGADSDLIFAQAGNDSVNGNFGKDTIDGGDGQDTLRGGKGEDFVFGGGGNDTLSGDLGSDTMTGGAGSDVFRILGNDASLIDTDLLAGRFETIADFADGEDRITLGFGPTGIAYGQAGTLGSATAAYAQTLLLGLGGHGVAAIQVGQDTVLYYGAFNGLVADSAVRLTGVTATVIDLGDFVSG